MDAASNVHRRNTLAKHLREVVDILEQKVLPSSPLHIPYYCSPLYHSQGDQIASLYDLLQFKDKPVAESVVPDRGPAGGPSWGGAAR